LPNVQGWHNSSAFARSRPKKNPAAPAGAAGSVSSRPRAKCHVRRLTWWSPTKPNIPRPAFFFDAARTLTGSRRAYRAPPLQGGALAVGLPSSTPYQFTTKESHGDEGARTLNPRLAKAVLSQLSYVPDCPELNRAIVRHQYAAGPATLAACAKPARCGSTREPRIRLTARGMATDTTRMAARILLSSMMFVGTVEEAGVCFASLAALTMWMSSRQGPAA
jgi:hypothetical protein